MNQRTPSNRSVANLLVGGAALLLVWASLASLQGEPSRDRRDAVAFSPAAMQEVLHCQRLGGADDECLASVLRSMHASRLAPVRKPLVGEQIQHRTGLA
jgi:hypothetical protein